MDKEDEKENKHSLSQRDPSEPSKPEGAEQPTSSEKEPAQPKGLKLSLGDSPGAAKKTDADASDEESTPAPSAGQPSRPASSSPSPAPPKPVAAKPAGPPRTAAAARPVPSFPKPNTGVAGKAPPGHPVGPPKNFPPPGPRKPAGAADLPPPQAAAVTSEATSSVSGSLLFLDAIAAGVAIAFAALLYLKL